jgi:hypothetical protein
MSDQHLDAIAGATARMGGYSLLSPTVHIGALVETSLPSVVIATRSGRADSAKMIRFGHDVALSLQCTAGVWQTELYLCFFSFFTRCFW